jgi:hypothetical protein
MFANDDVSVIAFVGNDVIVLGSVISVILVAVFNKPDGTVVEKSISTS